MADIEYEELAANLESFVVLDVRGRDEVKKAGQIPGSHCLPIGELEDAFELDDDTFQAKYGFAKPSAEQTLVTHCQMGGRARRAGDALAKKGLQARVYVGSFGDWTAKGGKVDSGKPFQPTN
ncbi:putative thiosulfate sulfurtransferase, mitochondrial [Portunus trituberculatus]|uniref:putative thiosulfate sulfurtransferase, mitochondrial n=1 Tax=Portunus trituberculatus TaxID=210409 RepID=UPI001E1CE41B|nr:putative thiosulfate sulfurtransferase, mitochondrial [Portunus trituberculatus]